MKYSHDNKFISIYVYRCIYVLNVLTIGISCKHAHKQTNTNIYVCCLCIILKIHQWPIIANYSKLLSKCVYIWRPPRAGIYKAKLTLTDLYSRVQALKRPVKILWGSWQKRSKMKVIILALLLSAMLMVASGVGRRCSFQPEICKGKRAWVGIPFFSVEAQPVLKYTLHTYINQNRIGYSAP